MHFLIFQEMIVPVQYLSFGNVLCNEKGNQEYLTTLIACLLTQQHKNVNLNVFTSFFVTKKCLGCSLFFYLTFKYRCTVIQVEIHCNQALIFHFSNISDDLGINFFLYFRSFVAADVDLDGKVSVEEFDSMIEAAAALPRLFFINFCFV